MCFLRHVFAFLAVTMCVVSAQEGNRPDRLEWFRDLGFGLFISTGSRPPAGPNAVGPRDNLLPGSTAEGGKLFNKTATTEKK